MGNLLDQLKRRNVFRVGIAYMVISWLILQVIDVVVVPLGLPGWTMRIVIILLGVGFPVALIFAWAFEMTPQGLQKTLPIAGETPVTERRFKIGVAVLSLGIVLLALWADKIPGLSPGGESVSVASFGGVDLDAPIPGFSGRAAIAVLPFINISGDDEQQYFADGLTEDVITGLQTYRNFPVIARTSTFAYQETNKDVRQIVVELGVGYIVQGSVRKSGDRVRISAQLVDAEGRQIWADNFDRPLAGLIEVEDEITGQIVNAIEPELILAETRRVNYVRSEDMEAFDYYLRALAETTHLFGYTDLHGRPVTRERNRLARELALEAIEKDPSFSRAYALLAHIEGEEAFMFRSELTNEEAAAALERSVRYGTIARQLSPFDSTACSCLAFVLTTLGRVDEALDIQRVAVDANPSHSNAHAIYAWALLFDGQNEFALEEIELAKRLSPRDMAMTTYLQIEAAIYLALGNLEMTANRAREATSMSPLNYNARILHILALDAMDRKDDAASVLAALFADKPDFTVEGLWAVPIVADVLLIHAGISLDAEIKPSYHEFVASRLAQLNSQS